MHGPENFGQSNLPPIPDPTGSPHNPAIVPPAGAAQVNFDVISHAWEVLKPTLGTWVVAFLIYIAITFGVSMLWGQLTGGETQTIPMPVPGGAPNQFQAPPVVIPNIPLLLLGNLIQLVISQFLMGGLYRMAIDQVRGTAPTIGAMFNVGDVLPALIGSAILTTIAMCFGFLFCIIPGLLLAGLFLFTTPLIVDRKMGAMEAINTSVSTLKPQMWMALVFTLMMGILAGSGVLLCGFGMLITGPLALLSIAILYRDFFPAPALA